MKIEMGESLFYSWLRHVKSCQIVQNNWKTSSTWEFFHSEEIDEFANKVSGIFKEKGYDLFGKSASISQIIQQGECDALGCSFENGENNYYAVDVAFHENGLNYGSRDETVAKVIEKTLRTAMCIWGYFDCKKAEVIFASPKVTPAVLNDIKECMIILNESFEEAGLEFNGRLIANEDFYNAVLNPILLVSGQVADTSELFLRAYQLLNLLPSNEAGENKGIIAAPRRRTGSTSYGDAEVSEDDPYKELKIGKIVQIVLMRLLESGVVPADEIERLQDAQYSFDTFNIGYPLLVKKNGNYDKVRYYSPVVNINGDEYKVCSQWFQKVNNNDRPYLLAWLKKYGN